jgi:hypothetical protein
MNSQNYYEEETRKDLELLRDLEDEYRLADSTLDKRRLKKQIEEAKKRIQERDNKYAPSTDQNLDSTEHQPLICEQFAIRFDLLSWVEIFRKSLNDPDCLLDKDEFSDNERPLFKDANQFILTSLDRGLNIELYDYQEKCSLRIQGNFDFWAILIASLSISKGRIGHLKWLIKKTFGLLKETKGENTSNNLILNKTWRHIVEKYCNSFSRYHEPEILREIIGAVICCAEEKLLCGSPLSNYYFSIRLDGERYSINSSNSRSTR